jgi:hypothetical protein
MSGARDRELSRRRLLALAPVLGVGACGFQPVYMPTASGNPGAAQRELAAVHVGVIPDRPGQMLREALQRRFGSDGGGAQRYELHVSYWISGEGISVLSNNAATRLRLTGNANWALTTPGSARTRLTYGHARTIDAMNVFDHQYFALEMQNEVVQRRIAEQIAEQIATQLALWFRYPASERPRAGES